MSAHVSAPYALLGVHMSCRLVSQASSNVTLDDVMVTGECCPAGFDSSLNLLFLIFVSGAARHLSHVNISFAVLYLSGVDVY